MDGKAFDIRLIPEFSGTITDMPIIEWIENDKLVCELCAMDKVERILPLRLRGGAPAVYRRFCKEQRTDAEQIKQALITAYATDKFNAFDQFVARHLRPGETVDKFLADLHRLVRLVGEPLPDRWMTCAFVSGLSQHDRQLLRASSRMDTMNVEQLLTRARAIMTDDGGCEVSAAASVEQPHSNAEVPSSIRCRGTVICYKCSGPNHVARNCTARGVTRPEGSDGARNFGRKQRCFRCNKIGHISSECQGNAEREKALAPAFFPSK